MKKASVLFEFILVIALVSIIYTMFYPKTNKNKLQQLESRITLYLKQTRYQALIDDKYEQNEKLWHKKRWTMKFFRCDKDEGGIYFAIYSDTNMTGHPNQKESLKDSLTNKYIYSTNSCQENNYNSKYVLLTKNYDIKTADISCNSTDSLGQISFGNDGRVYSKLSNYANEQYNYEIKTPCKIRFIAHNNEFFEIKISPKTGFIQ